MDLRRMEMNGMSGESGRISVATLVVILLIVAAAVVGTLAIRGDSGKADGEEATEQEGEQSKEKTPVPVEVMTAYVGPVSSWISATGNLVAENEVQVISETEGRVRAFRYEEGEPVSRGAVMVTLVSDEEEIALSRARARAENAQAAFDRAQGLWDQSLLSKGDYDKTAMEKRVADQDLAEAQWRLGRKVVNAPISGIVTLRKVQVGQQIRPGDQLYTITDFDPMIADLYLPEREAMALTEGRAVKLTPRSNPELSFTAEVRRVSTVVDRQTGTVKVTVEATGAPSGLRPGTFIQADIVRETHENAVIVDKEAVVRELGRSYVFVAKDGVATRRDVELGIEDEKTFEILSGVEAGERVIVEGQGGLKEGAAVKVIGEEAAS
ncbi:MAG: efflux RND transporter periplasmic adaptor subunit [Acidobacteria bacterium]|nr:efflux RND transporter periplasmic adaptor subunit [Acidobacteriota bacterium]